MDKNIIEKQREVRYSNKERRTGREKNRKREEYTNSLKRCQRSRRKM